MTDEKKSKTDEEVLFPEVTIGDIVVKPWSFGMLFEISEDLGMVLDKMEEKNIDISGEGFISYQTMARIFSLASIHVLRIISVTLDKDVAEVKKLSMPDGINIAMTIYKQNEEQIKNALSLTL